VSATAQFWLLTLLLAIGTWAMRALPIMLHGHVAHPPWLEKLLKHVPVAALTALVVPGALYAHVGDAYLFAPARLLAAIAAFVVALRTKNVFATLVVGMVALWLAQWGLATFGIA
jgi:branched-subunit amino acid transport protein